MFDSDFIANPYGIYHHLRTTAPCTGQTSFAAARGWCRVMRM